MERRTQQYNATNGDRLSWIVRYDDLNPVMDRIARHFSNKLTDEQLVQSIRLEDHMDAIMSIAVTQLVDVLLGIKQIPARGNPVKTIRKMPRQKRVDLAQLVILYDQPHSGNTKNRFARLRRKLRLSPISSTTLAKWVGLAMLLLTTALGCIYWLNNTNTLYELILLGTSAAGTILLLSTVVVRYLRLRLLSRRIQKELCTVERTTHDFNDMFSQLSPRDLFAQPLPATSDQDNRYQLMSRLMDILEELGYAGMVVFIDRIDEPAVINGRPDHMRSLIWPMLNNKFLQQDRIGIKLLLPLELRHILHRESSDFFQKARLDKQHLIDRLTWSGSLLYDLCTRRLQACQRPSTTKLVLTDLFADDVTSQNIIDALDQMQQPRDAFKFLYQVIQEHCSSVTDEQPVWKIPHLMLDQIRKQQSQRVQEFHRGITPA